MKFCTQCSTPKTVPEFAKNRRNKDGLASWCRPCNSEYRRDWGLRNPGKISGYHQKSYSLNAEKHRQRSRDWSAANPERKAATDKAYRLANLERLRQTGRVYRQRNAERIAEGKKRWKEQNLEKVQQRRHDVYWSEPERYREAAGEFKRANRARYNLLHAQRKARKRNASPLWLTEEHRRVMQFTYDLAAACSAKLGQPYHVDHFVPLNGKGVCGLHVPWNLRAIPAIDNMRKNNELPDELQGWRRPDGSRCG